MSFVVPTSLATSVDLAAWTQTTAPANAVILLRSATTLVLAATSGAVYAVDVLTGLATDVATLKALNDATCIQAAAWDAIKYNPLAGGVVTSSVKKSKKIATAAIEYADADLAAHARAAAIGDLVPDALRLLRLNGLITSRVGASR